MKIKQILKQHRRDFVAIYICEYCGNETQAEGYDDLNFHNNIIPTFVCPKCGEGSSNDYRPLQPKYPQDYVI